MLLVCKQCNRKIVSTSGKNFAKCSCGSMAVHSASTNKQQSKKLVSAKSKIIGDAVPESAPRTNVKSKKIYDS